MLLVVPTKPIYVPLYYFIFFHSVPGATQLLALSLDEMGLPFRNPNNSVA